MKNMLGHHVNKAVFISAPSIFSDDDAHACVLLGIEPCGLWLESEELTEVLFAQTETEGTRKVFIPFAQIRYLMECLNTPSLLSDEDDAKETPPSSRVRQGPASRAKKRR
jgi:hypothetical protein